MSLLHCAWENVKAAWTIWSTTQPLSHWDIFSDQSINILLEILEISCDKATDFYVPLTTHLTTTVERLSTCSTPIQTCNNQSCFHMHVGGWLGARNNMDLFFSRYLDVTIQPVKFVLIFEQKWISSSSEDVIFLHIWKFNRRILFNLIINGPK